MLTTINAIALSRHTVNEADILANVLSESGHKLTLKSHGLKKSKKRSQLILEPGSSSSFTVYLKPGGVSSLKESILNDRFDQLKANYNLWVLAAHFLEISERASGELEQPRLYELLLGSLRALNSFSEPERQILVFLLIFFRIRMLDLMGLLGEIEHCARCGAELRTKQEAYWNLPELFFTCGNCSPLAGAEDYFFSQWIGKLRGNRFGNLIKTLDTGMKDEIWQVFEQKSGQSIQYAFDTPLESMKSLGSLHR